MRTGEDSLPEGTNHKFMHSHVVLAACRQQQSAQECLSAAGEPRGFFTDGLIKQLRRVGPNRITYADLVDLLPTLPHQNPQCEGANTERCIFDVEGPAQTYTLAVNEDGTMEVDAGTVHGVVVGTQFALNADQEDADRILVAASVSVDSSALIPVAPGRARVFPDGGRIVVADWHKDAAMMSVYIRTSEDPPLAAADASAHSHGRTSFLVVDSRDSADLAVARTEKDEFALTRLDAKLSRYELLDVRLPASTANLPTVLDAIAHFNYFLAKRPAHDALALSDVRLEMYNLRGEYGARVPNMEQGNLVDAGGEVRFRLDTQEKYGFAICNYSRRDLFAYLFYFDPASYSIDVRSRCIGPLSLALILMLVYAPTGMVPPRIHLPLPAPPQAQQPHRRAHAPHSRVRPRRRVRLPVRRPRGRALRHGLPQALHLDRVPRPAVHRAARGGGRRVRRRAGGEGAPVGGHRRGGGDVGRAGRRGDHVYGGRAAGRRAAPAVAVVISFH